jgi:hypothetical protein
MGTGFKAPSGWDILGIAVLFVGVPCALAAGVIVWLVMH